MTDGVYIDPVSKLWWWSIGDEQRTDFKTEIEAGKDFIVQLMEIYPDVKIEVDGKTWRQILGGIGIAVPRR